MYAQKKVIDNVHIVRERDRQRYRELRAVLLIGFPIGVFLFVFTFQNLQVIQLGHEATRLQKQRKDVEDANKALQLELDRLTALDAVEKKATALGFQPTDARAVVMVEKAVSDSPVRHPPFAPSPLVSHRSAR
jgi:cell division protein FtsL